MGKDNKSKDNKSKDNKSEDNKSEDNKSKDTGYCVFHRLIKRMISSANPP